MTQGMVQSAHWPLIFASYALTAGAIAVTAAWIWIEGRRRAAELKRLEAIASRDRSRT